MKKLLLAIAALMLINTISFSQHLTTTPSGGNKKAITGERIGITDVVIQYSRPGVKGREGKIWGQLIHTGLIDQGFGSSKAAPWRAGANENTTIEFSTDVTIEGQPLPAGKYAFFVAYDSLEPMLIFSKNAGSWGSYFYDPREDALRVKVKPATLDKSVEWLTYSFNDQKEDAATINLSWEKLVIPFKVGVDLVQTQLASFRNELRTEKGFSWQTWNQAAQWSLAHNTNIDQALQWADTATSVNFGGDRSFESWSTKAQLLARAGRTAEADAAMKKALPLASMFEMHQYARTLLAQKKNREALDVFKSNYDKNPNQFVTALGLARGYSANADYKNALKYANQALPLAPTPQEKSQVENMVRKLKDGKDVN